MTEYVTPGRKLVGTVHGFSGTGSGATQSIARQRAYIESGLHDTAMQLLKNAMAWSCEPQFELRSGVSVNPMPCYVQDPIDQSWSAALEEATLKVWVECIERTDLAFEQRANQKTVQPAPFASPESFRRA